MAENNNYVPPVSTEYTVTLPYIEKYTSSGTVSQDSLSSDNLEFYDDYDPDNLFKPDNNDYPYDNYYENSN